MMRIRQLALSIWKTEMIDCITSEKLVKLVMQEVEMHRNGGIVNYSAIHGVITSFIDVNISEEGEESTDCGKEIFETLYFKDTWNYYSQKSRSLT